MAVVTAAVHELSEEETSLYDRQIRVWGLESQKRLRATRVLLVGLNGLGAEVAKNLVLAGIKSITLLDHRTVTEDDFSTQFMIERTAIGENRAHSSKAYARNLNPMVEVESEEGQLIDRNDDYFRKFDIVCCTERLSTGALIKINSQCRSLGVKFYCGHVWGYFGFFFSDLIEHTYTQELPAPPCSGKGSSVGPIKSNKAMTEVNASTMTRKMVTGVPLAVALQVKAGKATIGLDKKTTPLFFLLHVVLRFNDKHQAAPLASDREKLMRLRDEVAAKLGIDEKCIPESLFDLLGKEMCAACAVIGGVLAQDIIKVASCKDQPLRNFFLFDGFECCGLQESIGR